MGGAAAAHEAPRAHAPLLREGASLPRPVHARAAPHLPRRRREPAAHPRARRSSVTAPLVGRSLAHYRDHRGDRRGRDGRGLPRDRHEARARGGAQGPAARGRDRTPNGSRRFEREARLLASLNHPNIAAIYGLEEADGHAVLVLELVEGEDLAAAARARARSRSTRRSGSPRQIAEALEAAHEQGHRPPRPEAGQRQGHARRQGQGARLRSRQGVRARTRAADSGAGAVALADAGARRARSRA